MYCAKNVVFSIFEDQMYGVSPAYFISRFGPAFSVGDVQTCLPDLIRLGFGAFQPEVYLGERIGAWQMGARMLGRTARDEGLVTTQFVAHFLLHEFGNSSVLRSNRYRDSVQRVIEIVFNIQNCPTIVVPIPRYEPETTELNDALLVADAYRRFENRIADMLEMVEAAGLRLGLEILPGSLVGGSEGFLHLADRLESASLGYCFDTGHAWSSHEQVLLIPGRLGNRIVGTHLCDNEGMENLSVRPGSGTIDWRLLTAALLGAGYTGSWDIEIGCAPELVESEYLTALRHLRGVRGEETKERYNDQTGSHHIVSG